MTDPPSTQARRFKEEAADVLGEGLARQMTRGVESGQQGHQDEQNGQGRCCVRVCRVGRLEAQTGLQSSWN